MFLADEPSIQTLLEDRGFELQEDPGKVEDVRRHPGRPPRPDAVAGPGRRGARLPGHGKRAARRAKGIEGALVDNDIRTITALDPADTRSFQVKVAGPAALLVAKIHKIAERVEQPDRLVAKDALDVLRLLQAIPTGSLAASVSWLRGEITEIVDEALAAGDVLFGHPGQGLDLVAAAVAGLADEDVARASLQALWADLSSASGS